MNKKLLLSLVLIILTIIAIPIFILAYLGFVPGLSTLLMANKPRDLGVHHRSQTYTEGLEKAGTSVQLMSDSASAEEKTAGVSFSGKMNVDASFTQEELSAFISECPGRICVMTETQIKIHEDGVVEMSGVLRMDRVAHLARALGYSDAEIKAAQDFVGYIKVNPSFYATGTLSVTNNQVDLNVTSAQIARVTLPDAFVTSNDAVAEAIMENAIQQIPNADIRSVAFVNGQLQFDGSIPEIQTYAP